MTPPPPLPPPATTGTQPNPQLQPPPPIGQSVAPPGAFPGKPRHQRRPKCFLLNVLRFVFVRFIDPWLERSASSECGRHKQQSTPPTRPAQTSCPPHESQRGGSIIAASALIRIRTQRHVDGETNSHKIIFSRNLR